MIVWDSVGYSLGYSLGYSVGYSMILKKVSYLVINQSNSKGILPEWPERGSLKAGLTAIACLTAVACLIAVACLTAIASLTATAYLTATACLTAVVCLTAARKGILPWKVTFNRTQIVLKRYIALEGTFWLYPNIVLINTLPCKVLFLSWPNSWKNSWKRYLTLEGTFLSCPDNL